MGVIASQQLAQTTDLDALGLAASAFPAEITIAVKNAHLVAASGVILGYASKRYALPWAQWDSSVVLATCRLATYTLMALRGFNPANPADQMVVKANDDTIAWCRDVSKGLVELQIVIDASPDVEDSAPMFGSEDPRGWLCAPSCDSPQLDGDDD